MIEEVEKYILKSSTQNCFSVTLTKWNWTELCLWENLERRRETHERLSLILIILREMTFSKVKVTYAVRLPEATKGV